MTLDELATKLDAVQAVMETHYCGRNPAPLDTVAIDAAMRLRALAKAWRDYQKSPLGGGDGALAELGQLIDGETA